MRSVSRSLNKGLKKIRKNKITKNELIADVIFFLVAASVSFLFVVFFDFHHTLYPGHNIFEPERIFSGIRAYWAGTLIGGIAGFFLIKLFLFGLKEEESDKK